MNLLGLCACWVLLYFGDRFCTARKIPRPPYIEWVLNGSAALILFFGFLLAITMTGCSEKVTNTRELLTTASTCCGCDSGTSGGEAGAFADSGSGMGGVGGEAGEGGASSGFGGVAGSVPAWYDDPQVLAWYRADDGYADKCTSVAGCPWGALIETGGVVATTANAIDGHASYSPRKASGGILLSTHNPAYYPPVHVLVIARGYAGSLHDAWVIGGSGVGLRLGTSTNHVEILGTLATQITTTPTAWHLYDAYFHGSISKISIDGGSWTNVTPGGLSQWLGVAIGGASPTLYRADVDVAEVIAYEGQMQGATRTDAWAYLSSRYPSLALPSSAPSEINTAATVASGVTLPSDFDFIVIGGQSQNSNYTSAGTLAFAANVYELGNDNVYKAAVSKYDDPTNSTDLISQESASALKVYGNAIALANQIVAASGRPLLIIPCAAGGSGIVEPQAGGVPWLIWDPAFPRGFGLRNSLMGSMVARTNDAIARGGKFRFLWWDQGQAEAESDAMHANALVGATQAALNYFYLHTGLTERTVYAQMAATPHGSNWALARANQTGLASASRLMVSEPDGPYETDGVHDGPAAADALGGLVANAALTNGW